MLWGWYVVFCNAECYVSDYRPNLSPLGQLYLKCDRNGKDTGHRTSPASDTPPLSHPQLIISSTFPSYYVVQQPGNGTFCQRPLRLSHKCIGFDVLYPGYCGLEMEMWFFLHLFNPLPTVSVFVWHPKCARHRWPVILLAFFICWSLSTWSSWHQTSLRACACIDLLDFHTKLMLFFRG